MQIWTVDGRSIYASRQHTELPERALLGLADIKVNGQVWRTFSVATRDRVIQVAQPLQIRERQLAADAALRSVAPLLHIAPLLARRDLVACGAHARAAAARRGRRAASATSSRSKPLPTTGLPDEVAPLVNALNALLQRLSGSRDAQRAFVADAAHELRSPLTALKLQLQMLQRAPDDGARDAAIATLGEGIERAARLVEQLLTLARSEPGASVAPFEPRRPERAGARTPSPTSCRSPMRAAARSSCSPMSASMCSAIRRRCRALARNLADNAVRYSPPGARVELRVGSEAGAPMLQVDDSGPGIPRDERERVFDRFYRRASSDRAGHRPRPRDRARRGRAPRCDRRARRVAARWAACDGAVPGAGLTCPDPAGGGAEARRHWLHADACRTFSRRTRR